MSKISPVGYLIVKTQEECGEAVQAASKILLHGADTIWDRHKKTNLEVFTEELADIAVQIAILLDFEMIDRKVWNKKFAEREEITLKKLKDMLEKAKEEENNNDSDGRDANSE